MKRFLAELLTILLFVSLIVLFVCITLWIINSDLPFWVKFYLLR